VAYWELMLFFREAGVDHVRRAVAVTGLGVVSPNGTGLPAFWDALCTGRGGIKPIRRFDASGLPTRIGGEVDDFDPERYIERKLARRLSRFAQFGLACARMAVDDSGYVFDDDDEAMHRRAVVFGTSLGGTEFYERQSEVLRIHGLRRIEPYCVSVISTNTCTALIAREFRITGHNLTISTGCSSALNAIAQGADLIRDGRADVVIAGGSEAPFAPNVFAGFCAARVLSCNNEYPENASRPFDAARDGYIVSEAGAAVVLEPLDDARARGARVYAVIAGYGTSNDCFGIFGMEPTGRNVVRAIHNAVTHAGLQPEDIDCVNAHGSSSALSDVRETNALKNYFGEHAYRLHIHSIKSMIGQPLGATGGLQVVASAMALAHNIIPPTINYEHPDPQCDLDYVPNVMRPYRMQRVLINNFGLGGNNISMVLSRVPEPAVQEEEHGVSGYYRPGVFGPRLPAALG